LVAHVFFDCDQCPTGKSSFTVDRMRAIVGTEGVNITTQVSSQVSTQVLPAHLIVDCPATGPEVQRPFSPTPAGQPHPVSPGDAVQKKK
jgi:hypothetical protein